MIKKFSSHVLSFLSITSGIICLLTAFLTFLIPLLPTLPFLFSALFLFLKGSVKFRHWFFFHPRIGKYARKYLAQSKKTGKYKFWYLVFFWIFSIVSLFIGFTDFYSYLFLLLIPLGVTVLILLIPPLALPQEKKLN